MVSDADFPATGSGREKLGFVIRQAMLQGEQDWRSVECFIREQFVEVSVPNSPTVEVLDPEGRDGMIHCGVTLYRLKLTLKRHGCFGRIELFPDLDQPNLAARVYLGGCGARNDFERQLLDSMEVGDSRPLHTPISDEAQDCLQKMATVGDRSWLEFARCDGSRQQLMELVRASRRVHATEVQVENETMVRSIDGRWTLARFTGGMLQERLVRWRKPALSIKVQTATASTPTTFESSQLPAPDGAYAVLKTKTDDKRGWLAAGQTLGGLVLHARTLGLPCVLFPNVLRQPELRAELRTAIGHKGFMQIIVCFSAARAGLLAGATELCATRSLRPTA